MTDTINPVAAAVSEAVYRQGIAPEDADTFADNLTEWLAANGYAIVQLPAMELDENGAKTWRVTSQDAEDRVAIRRSDGRIGMNSVSNPVATAEHALSLAAGLIAAAKRVEEDR